VVDGALRACRADPDLQLLLVGTRVVADEAFAVLNAEAPGRIDVLIVDRHVAMDDPAARGTDPHTSIGAAMHLLAGSRTPGSAAGSTLAGAVGASPAGMNSGRTGPDSPRVDAVVSAGASGAIVAAAVVALGRATGFRRPALAAILPATNGPLVLLDVGAGLQVRPGDLVQHALLGSWYAQLAVGIAAPRVGLLSVGSEPGKGDRLRRVAHTALRSHRLPGPYVGMVEGQDVVTAARADVVITDGFTGNVLLKGLEALLTTALLTTRPEHRGPSVGGPRAAALLGVAGTVVVCHGAADGGDVASGVALAAALVRGHSVVSPVVPRPSDGPDRLAEVHP
jgi:glycerol-3-phosphate acyltransferase PlsX